MTIFLFTPKVKQDSLITKPSHLCVQVCSRFTLSNFNIIFLFLFCCRGKITHNYQIQPTLTFTGLIIIWFCIPQFRGSEIFELQNFKPATVDDIASVHAKAYVAGLEKVTSGFHCSFLPPRFWISLVSARNTFWIIWYYLLNCYHKICYSCWNAFL